ncbi:coiled-coil domain-containing protein 50 [Crotalus adamanteus]|uniref:Coiled-coil domain-containing protein 50 n=1 Tax=Crotalus adamanteus TaxID=8729 RepID=A0AAW1BH06_CROAD
MRLIPKEEGTKLQPSKKAPGAWKPGLKQALPSVGGFTFDLPPLTILISNFATSPSTMPHIVVIFPGKPGGSSPDSASSSPFFLVISSICSGSLCQSGGATPGQSSPGCLPPASGDQQRPERSVCRDFAVREDHTLAHSLQEQEIEHHLATNIQRNRLVKHDLQMAKQLQEEEDRKARIRLQEQHKNLEQQDCEIAQEIQVKLVIEAEQQRRQEEGDEDIARILQQKELQEEKRRKKPPPDPLRLGASEEGYPPENRDPAWWPRRMPDSAWERINATNASWAELGARWAGLPANLQ